jgi:hypothetical protein
LLVVIAIAGIMADVLVVFARAGCGAKEGESLVKFLSYVRFPLPIPIQQWCLYYGQPRGRTGINLAVLA